MAFKAGSLDLLGRMGALEKKLALVVLSSRSFDTPYIILYTISTASGLYMRKMCCKGFRGNCSLIGPGSIRLCCVLFDCFVDLCGLFNVPCSLGDWCYSFRYSLWDQCGIIQSKDCCKALLVAPKNRDPFTRCMRRGAVRSSCPMAQTSPT